jgi:hypothetical protein
MTKVLRCGYGPRIVLSGMPGKEAPGKEAIVFTAASD